MNLRQQTSRIVISAEIAVVAGKVKHLANQTARATEYISAQIGAVQRATQEAVAAIGTIVERIGEINEISAAVAAAVEEQTAEIARNVQQAADGTRDVTKNIAGVTEAAAATGQAASEVLSAAHGLSEKSEGQRSLITSFLGGV